MDLTIRTRKNIWKHRSGTFTTMDFASWDGMFVKRPEKEQKEIYEDYMKSLNTLDCMVTAVKECPPCCKAIPVEMINTGTWNSLTIYDHVVPNKTKKMETTMHTDTRTEAQQAKDYLFQSLDQAIWKKEGSDLPEAYGLVQKMPKTVGELKQAVADGWLRLDTGDRKDEKHIYSWMDYLVFSDPKVKRDDEGYEKAIKALRAAASEVKDQIVVFGPEKGLEALNAFKAQTF